MIQLIASTLMITVSVFYLSEHINGDHSSLWIALWATMLLWHATLVILKLATPRGGE